MVDPVAPSTPNNAAVPRGRIAVIALTMVAALALGLSAVIRAAVVDGPSALAIIASAVAAISGIAFGLLTSRRLAPRSSAASAPVDPRLVVVKATAFAAVVVAVVATARSVGTGSTATQAIAVAVSLAVVFAIALRESAAAAVSTLATVTTDTTVQEPDHG